MTEPTQPFVLEVTPPGESAILFDSADHDHPIGYEELPFSGLVRVFTVVPSPPFGPQIHAVSFGPRAIQAVFPKGTKVVEREAETS